MNHVVSRVAKYFLYDFAFVTVRTQTTKIYKNCNKIIEDLDKDTIEKMNKINVFERIKIIDSFLDSQNTNFMSF